MLPVVVVLQLSVLVGMEDVGAMAAREADTFTDTRGAQNAVRPVTLNFPRTYSSSN
jgi:hypothetical protein